MGLVVWPLILLYESHGVNFPWLTGHLGCRPEHVMEASEVGVSVAWT